ncbi:hypothetical protein C8F04DRAFT_1115115 [Mycena alexandri]|uniref:SET domain-containing protein n=1 Tax=Mycena alexandri TaxID=1745969 RepID=A0AAD6SLT1_9AGAR|nr:hypothetical protein C8F04DRAFT_1115115 [Mycena alexandri]
MKRGFLNTSKAKKTRPLGLPTDPVADSNLKPSESIFSKAPFPGPAKPTIEVKRLPIGKVEKVALPKEWKRPAYEVLGANDTREPTITWTTQPEVRTNGKDPFTECVFYRGTKEVLKKIPGYPQPLIHPKPGAFRVNTVPGKGTGLFSTRALTMGEHILTERPLLISPIAAYAPYPPSFTYEQYVQLALSEMEQHIKIAVDRMSPNDRAAYMQLANSHKEDGSGPCFGILRTNGLGISGLRPDVEGAAGRYSAVAKYISRLNHSCSPNTQPLFDKASLSYQLFAVRDIAAGEELTFQYTDVGVPAAQRNEELKPYDFVCTCTACTEDVPASDARRVAIIAFNPNTLLWAIDPKLPDDWLLKQCHEQLARIETEGLEHLQAYHDATKAIMDIYMCLGNAQKASEWAVRLNKNKWQEDDSLNIKSNFKEFEDPTDTAAYEAHMMWRMRAPGGSPTSNVFRSMAALAGPNGIKSLPGGLSLMMFPGPPPPF